MLCLGLIMAMEWRDEACWMNLVVKALCMNVPPTGGGGGGIYILEKNKRFLGM